MGQILSRHKSPMELLPAAELIPMEMLPAAELVENAVTEQSYTINFFGFPFEIREMIYAFIFQDSPAVWERIPAARFDHKAPGDAKFVFHPKPGGESRQILHTSKQVAREATPICYGLSDIQLIGRGWRPWTLHNDRRLHKYADRIQCISMLCNNINSRWIVSLAEVLPSLRTLRLYRETVVISRRRPCHSLAHKLTGDDIAWDLNVMCDMFPGLQITVSGTVRKINGRHCCFTVDWRTNTIIDRFLEDESCEAEDLDKGDAEQNDTEREYDDKNGNEDMTAKRDGDERGNEEAMTRRNMMTSTMMMRMTPK